MREAIAIFTSGKGGVGKTPFALLLAILLRRFGVNVLTLDFNSLNPDYYEIFKRFIGERPEILTHVGGERLPYPLAIIKGVTQGGGKIYCASRIGKFRYLPYPPYAIFETLIKLREYLNEPFFAIVDTNLNIPGFNISLEEAFKSASAALNTFRKVLFFHIWSPGSFRKGAVFVESHLEVSEVEQIRSTILNYTQHNINIFGKEGESIIHIITPRLFEEIPPTGFGARLSFILKRLFGKKPEISSMPLYRIGGGFSEDVFRAMAEAYERSYRTLKITDILVMREKFNGIINELISTYKNFAVEVDPMDIEIVFFTFMLETLYDKATRTLPLNAIIVPFMVRKLVNFVDSLLISTILDEDSILEREGPIAKIFEVWINKVLMQNKL
mgnify:CR=1 FL=1